MQDYQTDPRTIYAIVGNFALMKCDIPSFLADFVTIHSWTDGTGNEYFSDIANKFGNFSVTLVVIHCEFVTYNLHHTSICRYKQNIKTN